MYDPFYWYEQELDNDHLAQMYGFENFEDYLTSEEHFEELEERLEL